jgi:fatty-acyl-CoA synthase
MTGATRLASKHETLQAALAAAAQSECGLTFVDLQEKETFVSYRELYQRARRAAAFLEKEGVRPGDRVGLILSTSPGFVDAIFGTVMAGAIPVPLYPPLRLGKLDDYHASTARMLSITGARLVVTEPRIRVLLGRSLSQARPQLGYRLADELIAEGNERGLSGHPEEVALIQFSSGATMDPKPVCLSHRNLLYQCAALHALLLRSSPPPHRGVSWLPLYHDMGLIGALFNAVYFPGPLVLIPPEHFLARPGLWLRAISRHRATASFGPNFGYALCVKRVRESELETVDLSSWRLAGNGAEPISTKVMRRFCEKFSRWGFAPKAFTPGYGLAEASLAVTYAVPGEPTKSLSVDADRLASAGEAVAGEFEIVSVGRPIPGTEVEIRNERGVRVPDRRVGRIHVRSPSVMSGYFGGFDPAAPALSNGWLDTGDLGFSDDGELYVCGRAKDLVIIRGANHAPQAFENCLEEVEGVRAGCAVALGFVPPDADGEQLLILAERGPGAHPHLEEKIRSAVLERTGILAHTVRILEPGTLPRTSSGKLRRREALRQFLANQLKPPRPVTAGRMAREVIRSAIGLARLGLVDEG